METAKVFWSGRSQAVRLPKEFRFKTSEVSIKKSGTKIILEPVADSWEWLDELRGQLDDDAAVAAVEYQEQQDRPELEKLFS
jgi:antitoxin VapB